MRMSATQTMKTRNEAKKLISFGKRWKSGETHIVGYPIFWDENKQPQILVYAAWGHDIDAKELRAKAIFWPTHSEIEDGVPKVADLAYQASKIMPLFLRGSYAVEVKKIEESALSSAEKKQALKQIDNKYEVDEDGRIGKKPAIGRLRYIVTTEIFDVPLTPDNRPNVKEARLVSQDLSDEKIRNLYALMTNPDYAPQYGDKVFWVQYAFGSNGDKKLDGRVSPTGFSPEYYPPKRFPDEFQQMKGDIESLPTESETIMKRNSVFQKKDEKTLFSAIQTYWILHQEVLAGITEESDVDRLRRVAPIVRSLQVPVDNPILKEEIAKLEEEEKKHPGTTINSNPYYNESAPKMENLIAEEDIQLAKAEAGSDEDYSAELGEAETNFASMVEKADLKWAVR